MEEPSRLLSLPVELQSAVLGHLLPYSISTLVAVSRVCKHLNSVSLPLIVHTFDGTNLALHSEPPLRRSRILNFLKYVTVDKPGLAQHVRKIVFGSLNLRNFTYSMPEPAVGATRHYDHEMHAYRGWIEKTCRSVESPELNDWESSWLADLKTGSHDAEVALLLVACPKVEMFCTTDFVMSRIVTHLLQAARIHGGVIRPEESERVVYALPLLSKLRSMYQESGHPTGDLRFGERASPYFYLPNLVTFECVWANIETARTVDLFLGIPRRSSSIRSIAIRASVLTAPVLHALTGACAAIESFEYTFGVYNYWLVELTARDAVEALQAHAGTLQHLYLNFEDEWARDRPNRDMSKAHLGTHLTGFVALKSLAVGMRLLTGFLAAVPQGPLGESVPMSIEGAPRLVDALPPNLERLEINGCGDVLLEQAQELLDALAGPHPRFPRLRSVRFLFHAEIPSQGARQLACDSASVDLEVAFQTRNKRDSDRDLAVGTWAKQSSVIADPSFLRRDTWLRTRGLAG